MYYKQSIVCHPYLFRFLFPFVDYNAICSSSYLIWQYETSAFKTVVTQLVTESVVTLASFRRRNMWNTTFFFVAYLKMPFLSQTVECWMVGWWTNDQFGGIHDKVIVALLRYCPVICLKELWKTVYQPRFQWTPQKYKSQMLTISPAISVMLLNNSAKWILSRSSEYLERETDM